MDTTTSEPHEPHRPLPCPTSHLNWRHCIKRSPHLSFYIPSSIHLLTGIIFSDCPHSAIILLRILFLALCEHLSSHPPRPSSPNTEIQILTVSLLPALSLRLYLLRHRYVGHHSDSTFRRTKGLNPPLPGLSSPRWPLSSWTTTTASLQRRLMKTKIVSYNFYRGSAHVWLSETVSPSVPLVR